MLVNLPTLTVLPQESPEHPHPPQPHHFRGHTSFGGTLAFTVTGVSTETFGGEGVASTGAGVEDGGLDDAVGVG